MRSKITDRQLQIRDLLSAARYRYLDATDATQSLEPSEPIIVGNLVLRYKRKGPFPGRINHVTLEALNNGIWRRMSVWAVIFTLDAWEKRTGRKIN